MSVFGRDGSKEPGDLLCQYLAVVVQKNLATHHVLFGPDGGDPSCHYLAVMVQKNLATIMSVFGPVESEEPGDHHVSIWP